MPPPADDIPPPAMGYDASLAMELLASTSELPGSKRDLLVVLAHYRHALHALATQVLAGQNPGTT